MKNYIDKKLLEMENSLKMHIDLKIRDVQRSGNNSEPILCLELPEGFPLNTKEEFTSFEENRDRHPGLFNYFVYLSGPDPKTAIRNFIKEAIGEDFIFKIKWMKDAKEDENIIIYKTQLAKIMFRSVRYIFQTANINASTFSTMMVEGIRASKQRARDRKRRDSRSINTLQDKENKLIEMVQMYEQD